MGCHPQRIGGPLRVTRPFPSCHDAYMVHEELRCGEKYGFRERPRFKTAPLECIQLLKHIRGRKWQARWIDTHPGLVDYINSVQMLRFQHMTARTRDLCRDSECETRNPK